MCPLTPNPDRSPTDFLTGEPPDSMIHSQDEVLDQFLAVPGLESTHPTIVTDVCNAVRRDAWDALDMIQEISDAAEEKRRMLLRANDRAMYKPLAQICDVIERSCTENLPLDLEPYDSERTNRPFIRRVVVNSDSKIASDDASYPSISIKPDIVIAEVSKEQSGVPFANAAFDCLRWRQCPAFIEVRASPAQIPSDPVLEDARLTMVEAAGSAHAILTARPFQIFIYGLLLCGTDFALAKFDRRGVIVSSPRKLSDPHGLECFVRLILRFTWSASPSHLGHDPTVSLLDGYSYHDQYTYPRFVVTTPGPTDATSTEWMTLGEPIWVSHSLFGRGTHVWHVVQRNVSPGKRPVTAVLKNAWRTENKPAESEIYEHIVDRLKTSSSSAPPVGLARYYCGGDVTVKLHQGEERLSVYALRPTFAGSSLPICADEVPDLVLTRVVLKDVGKPLWEYTSNTQLGRTLLSVLEAHKTLSEHDTVHRDISPANILILVKAVYKAKPDGSPGRLALREYDDQVVYGFLTDFKLASISALGSDEPAERVEDVSSGTLIFMPTGLLYALERDATAQPNAVKIRRGVAQDLESFGWAILYAVYRGTLASLSKSSSRSKREAHDRLYKEFHRLFGATSPRHLITARRVAFDEQNTYKYMELFGALVHNRPLSVLVAAVWHWLRHRADHHIPRQVSKFSDHWRLLLTNFRVLRKRRYTVPQVVWQGSNTSHSEHSDDISIDSFSLISVDSGYTGGAEADEPGGEVSDGGELDGEDSADEDSAGEDDAEDDSDEVGDEEDEGVGGDEEGQGAGAGSNEDSDADETQEERVVEWAWPPEEDGIYEKFHKWIRVLLALSAAETQPGPGKTVKKSGEPPARKTRDKKSKLT